MGKGGVVLGLIGLLIGAGGLTLGLITFIGQQRMDFWYDYEEAQYYPPDLEYQTIADLYVIVDLDAPSTLHILFTTSTRILPNPASFADIIFYFWIDGVRLLDPITRAGPYEGDATYQYYPVALQHLQAFSAGTHNISIVVWSETAGNMIRSSSIAINRV
jgi:hypothetical protein